MKRRILQLVVILSLLSLWFVAPAEAQGVSMPGDEKLQLRADYWMNQLFSEVKITTGAFLGTTVDAFDTLGMDVHKQTIIPVVASYSRFGFRFEFWRNIYEGDKNLDETVIFNGTVYPVGDHLQSKLTMDNYDARVFLDLLSQKKLDLYPIGGIRYKRYEVWLNDLTTGDSDNEILHAPMPYVGGGIRFNISRYISFGGELAIMNITFSEYNLKLQDYMDFQAYAEIRVTPMLAAVGGFRYLTYRLSASRDDVDYYMNEKMQGIFFGAALTF